MATKEFGVNKLNINSSTVVEGILDEDDLSSDSNVKLATQQSIKAYVDGKVTTDLDVSDGTTDISIDFGTEKLSILGTSGEINSVASGNDVTLSVPGLAASKITSGSFAVARIPNLGAGKITSGTFDAGRIPTLNQDTTGSAAKVKVTDNESTDEENLITFVADAVNTTGPQSLEMDGDLKYNPNTGTLSSPAISIGGASPSPSALSVKLTTNKHIGFNPNQSEVGYVPSLVAFNDSGSLQDMGFRGTTLRFAQASTERLHINSSGLLVNGSIKNIASIVNCSITSGGTDGGRTEGSYTVIDAGGSVSGTGADFVVDIDATGAAELTKKSGGTGYAANETITIAKADIGGGSADLVITVSSITPVVQFHGNGSNLTNLNGTNITSGTIAAARVATLNQNTSGSSASCTGNAATATKLAAAVNIGGVSFDGSAAINLPGVNAAGNQNTSGNAATATKLAAAVNIGGVSFDGTANINLPGVNAAGNQNTSGTAAGLSGTPTVNLYHNNKLRLEPVASGVQVLSGNASPYPLGTVTASSFVGALTGNASSATLATNAQGLTGTPNILIGNATATKVTTSTLEVGDISRGVNNGSVNITQEGTGLFTVHRTTESRDTRPETDSQYDLGEHAKRWRNVYADTLFGDGSNITNLPTGGISDIVSDTTPQLGGNLDPNGKNIEFGDSTTFGSDDTLSFGADDDFSIFHGESGSSYNDLNVIKTKNPAPHLLVELGSADGLKMMQVSGKNTNGTSDTLALFTTVGSQLYYNGTNRIGTTSSGSTLTGTVIFTGLIDANGGIDGTLNAGAQPNITSIGAATGGAGGVTSIRFNELDFKRTQVLWSSKYQWNYKIETSTLADHRINFFDDEQGNCSISLLTGNRAGGTSIIRSGKSSGNAGGTPGIYDTTIGASVHVAQNDGDVTLCTNTGYGPMGGIGGGHQNNGFEFSLGGTSKFCTESGNSDATVTMMRRDDGKAISFCEVISSSSISEIGSITLDRTANTTSFNENSDYRLKENVTNITGALAKINQLRPVNFNFIGKSVKLDGFLAHEVQAVAPYAVHGEKDAVQTVKDGDETSDGSFEDEQRIATLPTKQVPKYQQLDKSKLIGLLTAAVQELSAKNDALEARIAALES